MKLLMAN